MTVNGVGDLHELLRGRLPELTAEDVVAVAQFLWDAGHENGLRSGDDWAGFLGTPRADLADLYELVQGPADPRANASA